MTRSTEHIHCRAETEPPNAATTGVNGYDYNCSVQNECSAFGGHHIHTHIPRLLPVHRQFIGNEDFRQHISNERPRRLHHTHSLHIPACCRRLGSSSAMRISGPACWMWPGSESQMYSPKRMQCFLYSPHSHSSYPCLLPVAGRFIGNEDVGQCISNQWLGASHSPHLPACCRPAAGVDEKIVSPGFHRN